MGCQNGFNDTVPGHGISALQASLVLARVGGGQELPSFEEPASPHTWKISNDDPGACMHVEGMYGTSCLRAWRIP